jgi:hypothetical protein
MAEHAVESANPITLRQAFIFIITAELTNAKVTTRVLATLQGRLKVLSPTRAAALKPKMQQVVISCVTQLNSKLNIVCDEAIEQTEDITITLGPGDYSELVNSDPTVMNYGETAAGITYGYLLGQFISGSATWAGFGGDYQKATKSITDMLDISDKIDGYITLRLDDHQRSLDKCTLIIGTVRQRVAALTAESVLGPLLGPLVLYCTGVLDSQEIIVNLCTRDKVTVQCNALPFSFVDWEADKALVSDTAWPLYLTCEQIRVDCVGLRDIIQPTVFDGLRKALAKGAQQKSFNLLLTALGGPGFIALSSLKPADVGILCDRWVDVAGEFVKKCPIGSSDEEILPYYQLVCQAKSALDGCYAIMGGTTPRINLPPNCIAMGWMKVNGILMPAAYSIGGFSTDQACMKHCKQELGAAPPKIKITAYFAELVQACTAAVQAWKGRGRMDMDPITVPSNGTIWHIVVGSGGQPIVHHIDSGYENSPWINHA